MSLDIIALGKSIRHYRKKRGMSQNGLSEIIGKSPTYLSYIENGLRCISLDTLVDLVNALNITPDILLKDSIDNTVLAMSNEFASVLADCSEYEQRILLETSTAIKASLRKNKSPAVQKWPR